MFTRSPQVLSSLKQAFQTNLRLAISCGKHYEQQFLSQDPKKYTLTHERNTRGLHPQIT
jgi:hypothetical protein